MIEKGNIQTDTLCNIDRLEKFNKWLYDKIVPFIGNRILEVGSGWGSFTKFFASRELVVGVDINKDYIERLKKIYTNQDNCIFIPSDISRVSSDELKKFNIDTVVIMNVLEHIENDSEILKLFYDVLVEKGHIVILVPAFNFIYGTLDKYLCHKRRYTSRVLRRLSQEAGFSITKIFYLNFFSMFGWFFTGRIFLRRRIPFFSIKIYNLLFPIFRFFEDHFHFPVGQSIVLIGEKEA